jgi:hypothetical protein
VQHPSRRTEHVILAVPDSERFRSYLSPLSVQLESIGIKIWFMANS